MIQWTLHKSVAVTSISTSHPSLRTSTSFSTSSNSLPFGYTVSNYQIYLSSFCHSSYQTRSRNFRSLALNLAAHRIHERSCNFNVYTFTTQNHCWYNRTKQSFLFSETQFSLFRYNEHTLECDVTHYNSYNDDQNSSNYYYYSKPSQRQWQNEFDISQTREKTFQFLKQSEFDKCLLTAGQIKILCTNRKNQIVQIKF